MHYKNNCKKRTFFITIFVAILAVFALFVTILENVGINSWQNVYKSIGIKESTDIPASYEMSVHFVDVGKADCIYVNFKDKNILIDGGEQDTYNTVVEYLQKKDVKKLDLVIATHPHSDHIGGLPEVFNKIKTIKVMMPKVRKDITPTSRIYEKFLLSIDKNKVQVKIPTPGEIISFDDLKIEVIAPNRFYENINNHSIVAKFKYKDISFLFTGDAEKESEQDILKKNYDIKSTILKVGHHGSRTSTSKNFLKKVKPKYAVICVGEDKYNLPKKETIKSLTECGAKIYRTDLDGTVVFATNGCDIKIITSKNKLRAA